MQSPHKQYLSALCVGLLLGLSGCNRDVVAPRPAISAGIRANFARVPADPDSTMGSLSAVARHIVMTSTASETHPVAATLMLHATSPHAVHSDPTSPRPSPRIYAAFPTGQPSITDGGSRGRHTAIGAAVGALAGLLVYAIDQHQCRPQNGIPCAVGGGGEVVLLVGGGALAGALVGAALPHDH